MEDLVPFQGLRQDRNNLIDNLDDFTSHFSAFTYSTSRQASRELLGGM